METTLIQGEKLKYVLKFTAENIVAIEDELNSLDRAIGDGDHGTNMSRGCQSLLNEMNEIGYDSIGEVLIFIGKTLISSIGGASGALYGTLFTSIGQHMGSKNTLDDFITAFDKGVSAMMVLGASDINQKTMLDVIVPVLELLKKHEDNLPSVVDKATLSSELTIAMRAEKGRASYLGDRSIGYLDPGAYSSKIIICSICEALDNHE